MKTHMLTLKLYLSVYLHPHCSHVYLLRCSISGFKCTFRCFLRLLFWVNPFPQYSHVLGFIPECILTWSSKLQVLRNSLLHPSCLHTYTVWVLPDDVAFVSVEYWNLFQKLQIDVILGVNDIIFIDSSLQLAHINWFVARLGNHSINHALQINKSLRWKKAWR